MDREADREKMWGRIYLTPFLQAENDREMVRRRDAALKEEQDIMQDVPGWEVGKSVYHGERQTAPRYNMLSDLLQSWRRHAHLHDIDRERPRENRQERVHKNLFGKIVSMLLQCQR